MFFEEKSLIFQEIIDLISGVDIIVKTNREIIQWSGVLRSFDLRVQKFLHPEIKFLHASEIWPPGFAA